MSQQIFVFLFLFSLVDKNLGVAVSPGFNNNTSTDNQTFCLAPAVNKGVQVSCAGPDAAAAALQPCALHNNGTQHFSPGTQALLTCPSSGYKAFGLQGELPNSVLITCGNDGRWTPRGQLRDFSCPEWRARSSGQPGNNGHGKRRIKRAYKECNGGSGIYFTYVNTLENNAYSLNAEGCFADLRVKADARSTVGSNIRWGCFHTDWGRCKCTADSSYIFWSYMRTFDEALANLKRHSNNFASPEGFTHEGSMYLTYIVIKVVVVGLIWGDA